MGCSNRVCGNKGCGNRGCGYSGCGNKRFGNRGFGYRGCGNRGLAIGVVALSNSNNMSVLQYVVFGKIGLGNMGWWKFGFRKF